MAEFVNVAWSQIARRRRQVSSIWKGEGYRGLAFRARKVAAEHLRPKRSELDVLPEDVLAANLSEPFVPAMPAWRPGDAMRLNWIVTPTRAGSGGHTTIFRIVRYLENNGFRNTIYFYDRFGGDHDYYVDVARRHYGVTCQIRDLRQGIDDADALIATAWECAYAVYNARSAGKRFYFVQDYEPAFYPTGTRSLLAENTYRMGFHGITAGAWLAEKLVQDFAMPADFFPFGCDTTRYFLKGEQKRKGVAFYARASTPRRGVELGLLALEILAARRPDVEIHLFGGEVEGVSFRHVSHGVVTPGGLNDIYNRCFAGLCLSLTNVSLVPVEMLAAGCIPVVNDARHNRMVLDNPLVRYSTPTPHALADALEAVMSAPPETAARAAGSVLSTSWDDAGEAVASCLRRTIDQARASERQP